MKVILQDVKKRKKGRKRSANWLRPKLLIKMVMRKKPIKGA